MDSPEHWRWVWLVVAAACAAGEMASPGPFFLLPFAVGAAVAHGQATRIFLPGDSSGLLTSLAGVADLLRDGHAPADDSR